MSEPLDVVEALRRPLETISQCRRMRYVTAEVAEIAAAEIARLREERLIVPVMGEIVDMEFSSELGVYYGTIRCPKCNWEGEVSPMADRPKCRCRIEWGFSVSAAGIQPLPTGPDAKEPNRE